MSQQEKTKLCVRQWWADVRDAVTEFGIQLESSPTSFDGDVRTLINRTMGMYTQLETMSAPLDADEGHALLKRGMFNLAMSYQSVDNSDWDKADIFYGRALTDWQEARVTLQRLGLLSRVA